MPVLPENADRTGFKPSHTRQLFVLGHVVATPGGLDLLDRTGTNANDLLERHQRGDWGEVCSADADENRRAVEVGNRILSSYPLGKAKERLCIVFRRSFVEIG